jgi:hypothetical protein
VIVGLVLAFGALVYGLARRPNFGLALVLVVFVATQSTPIPLSSGALAFGTFSVYPFDAVAAALLCVGVYRLTTIDLGPAVVLSVGLLSILLVVHIAWGALRFGIEPSVTGSRGWIYFVATLLYASTVIRPWSSQARTLLIAAAGVLSIIGLVQILQNGFPSASETVETGGITYSARPLVAAAALVLLQSLILLFGSRHRAVTPGIILLGILLAGMIISLQHRTVWVAAICVAPFAYWAWALQASERRRNAVTGIAVISLPLVVIAFTHTSDLRASVETTRGDRTTFTWRIDSWVSLTKRYDSVQDRLVGVPSGISLAREIQGIRRTESAHSLYVDALLSFGILGVAAVVNLWLMVFRRRDQAGIAFGVSGVAVIALIASQVIFGITYNLGAVQGAILGILLSSAYRSNCNRSISKSGLQH